ncbi:permease [bacterium]|nr:permease [bacterium]
MMEEKQEKKKKVPWGLRFMLIMFGVYIFGALFSKYFFAEALINTLITLGRIIPVLALVFIFMVVSNIFLKPERIKQHLGHRSGKLGWFYAVLAGILMVGPPYILFPILEDFKKKGMADSFIAVLLYNRNVKIAFLPIMIFYFGLPYTVVVSVLIILFSILNGLIIDRFTKYS